MIKQMKKVATQHLFIMENSYSQFNWLLQSPASPVAWHCLRDYGVPLLCPNMNRQSLKYKLPSFWKVQMIFLLYMYPTESFAVS